MAGGDSCGSESSRNLCKLCNKPAVSKVVKCSVCSDILHRFCCDRKHLEVTTKNTTICCRKSGNSDCNSKLNNDNVTFSQVNTSETDKTVNRGNDSKLDDSNTSLKRAAANLTCTSQVSDSASEAPSGNSEPLVLADEEVEDVDGGCSMKVTMNSLLVRIEALLQAVEKPCCCKTIVNDLVEENKKLKKTVEAQSIIIRSLKDDFNSSMFSLQSLLQSKNKHFKSVTKDPQCSFLRQQMSPPNTDHGSEERVNLEEIQPSENQLIGHKTNNDDAKEFQSMSGVECQSQTSTGDVVTGASRETPSKIAKQTTQINRDVLISVKQKNNLAEINSENCGWTKVEHGRAKGRRGSLKSPVVGALSLDNAGLRAVPKKSFLHVTRLHPETTAAELRTFLEGQFPDVECELIKSKFPEKYASFKVAINRDNVDEAMNPQLWPRGTYVNKFFQRRYRGPTTK